MTGQVPSLESPGAAGLSDPHRGATPDRCPRPRTADRPAAAPQAVPDPGMTINTVIRLCLERGQADGWGSRKQRELASQVVRRLRPQWSDSQISDAVSRAARGGPAGPVGP